MKSGWKLSNLEEVCGFQNGFAFKSNKFTDSGFPILRISNIQDEEIETRRVVYFNPKDYKENLDKYRVANGDLLIAMSGATTGKIGFNTTDNLFYLNQRVGKFEPQNALLIKQYLFYFLLTMVEESLRISAGSAQPNLSTEQIKAFKIPLPPLPEQHHIVAILDTVFENIATAKSNAEKNLKNARELFESYLQDVFTKKGIGWVETKLEDVCGFQNGFAFKSSTFKQSGVPIIRISNIQDGRIDSSNRLAFFDPMDYHENLERYRIVKDDLLIAMSGATTGKLGFNTESTVFYLNQRIGKFEPDKRLNKRFLYYFLSTKVEENLRISAGAAQPNLSTEQIKGFALPLPSVDEQGRIVEALEILSKETQHFESIYQKKIAALDELKKALLHKAFSGEL